MMIQNKKGISTVEIIVSFTIFMGFVVFIFLYLNPIKQNISGPLLTALDVGFRDQAMTDLREWPVAVNKSNAPGCLKFSIPFESKGNISVKDINDNTLTYRINLAADPTQSTIDIGHIDDKLYRLIQSDEIDSVNSNSLSDCQTPLQFSLSVERIERIYSYKKLVAINDSYYNDYAGLKQKLDFPITSDFGIIITSDQANFTMQKNIPNVQIKVRTFPAEILKNDKKLKATISLLVW